MATGWTNGSTRQWRRVRATVLARDLGRCQLCLPGCTGVATCVHHVYGRAVTGDDLRYLVASCRTCNLRIGQPGRRGRRKAAGRMPPGRQLQHGTARRDAYNRW
jgi:hypothetical protein